MMAEKLCSDLIENKNPKAPSTFGLIVTKISSKDEVGLKINNYVKFIR